MAKYKIKVIGHLIKGNKVAKAGEVVDESQLLSPAYELVKGGFISLVEEAKNETEEIDLDSMTKAELKQYAESKEYDLDFTVKKEVLLSQIKELDLK